mgnify:CR=1 FL=1
MPFSRPTLRALVDRAIADINARLPGADARLPLSNLNVLAHVHGQAAHGLYGYIDWLSRQILPDTADVEYLDRWAGIWGVTRTAAAPATGSAVVTGATGAVIPVGTLLQRADGAQYQTTTETTLVAGAGTLALTAVLGGAAGNVSAGTLSLVTPIAGVNAVVTLAGDGMTGGADVEVDTALRARLLARIRQPPHGGADFDYKAWALEVPGVTRAWVYPLELGLGTVTVRFVRDNDASIIPDSGEVAAVQAYIDARRPVTAQVTVVAPIADPVDFTITGLVPSTAAVQAAVQAELEDLLLREAEPGGTVLISHIRAAISSAAGETDYVLTSPSANVTAAPGEICTMGTVTWV